MATILLLSSCETHHVVQRKGNAMVVNKDINGAHLLAPGPDGTLIPGKGRIPEGAIVEVPPKDFVPDK